MNPLVGFGGSIARNCGETQILSSWNCSAHWPGRVNVCVLYLHDSSAHCICYHNRLNMVVPENLPRDRALALEAGGPGLDTRLRRGVPCSTL